jgi:predicted phosphodiesterase
MRIALFSDIHANIEALTRFKAYLDDDPHDLAICLGDVVGYGASPNPCCELVREIAHVTLMGNHDAAVIGAMDTDFYYTAARNSIYWTREQLTGENFKWLFTLPYTYSIEELGIGLFHSAPIVPSGFYYVVKNDDARAHGKVFDLLPPISFIGHSHLTYCFEYSTSFARELSGNELVARESVKYIINIGSIGQPRDNNPRACFLSLDTDTMTFEHIRIEYDIDASAKRVLDAGLDKKFANRLFKGI